MEAKIKRHLTLVDTRKTLVLEAAKVVFAQFGLEGASVREIAKRAGYTPGALYTFFPSKKDLFLGLVDLSLQALEAEVKEAKPQKGRPEGAFLARAQAWFVWLEAHPRDLELLQHSLITAGALGDNRAARERLQTALSKTLDICASDLVALGAHPEEMPQEMGAMAAMGMGLLLLTPPGPPAQTLFQSYAEQVCVRLLGAPVGRGGAEIAEMQSAQTDLFV